MQTVEGGKKAAKTNIERYGEDFYRIQGAKGGRVSRGGGFAKKTYCDCTVIYEPHFKAQCAGVKGGQRGKRGKASL
jgi:hypothetical protein